MNTEILEIPEIPDGMTIQRTSLEVVLPLRHQVQRPSLKISDCHFHGDKEAIHVALFVAKSLGVPDGGAIACLSLMLFFHNHQHKSQEWRIRGMAIKSEYRYKGCEEALLSWSESLIRLSSPVHELWQNISASDAELYEKRGWKPLSPPFNATCEDTGQYGLRRIMGKHLLVP